MSKAGIIFKDRVFNSAKTDVNSEMLEELNIMKSVNEWITGSYRGYVLVKQRNVEGEIRVIPDSLKGLRGNRRWALKALKEQGATHYTVKSNQGVPGKGMSTSYCYDIYTGYKD